MGLKLVRIGDHKGSPLPWTNWVRSMVRTILCGRLAAFNAYFIEKVAVACAMLFGVSAAKMRV
jgi:hypothetical protein